MKMYYKYALFCFFQETDFLAHKCIPSSSHTSGSDQHMCKGLKYLKTTAPKPAQAFTDESRANKSQCQGLDPTEKFQEPEPEQILEDKRSDQDELKRDDERSCGYDPEEGMPAVVVTQAEEVSGDQNISSCHVFQNQYDLDNWTI